MDRTLSRTTACCSGEGRLDLGLQRHRENKIEEDDNRQKQILKQLTDSRQMIADSERLKNANLGVNYKLVIPSLLGTVFIP